MTFDWLSSFDVYCFICTYPDLGFLFYFEVLVRDPLVELVVSKIMDLITD